MKAIRSSFMQMLFFVRRDMMLFVSCLVPVLAGLFFKFGIPAAEDLAENGIGVTAFLTPYYGLFDLLLSMLTPTMFCFAAAMVILEEHDDHIETYLFITTLGRRGYLISRIGLPVLTAFVITLALLPVFSLTALSVTGIFLLSSTGAMQGVIISLLIVTLSTNKLEGMAVTKISTLTMLGAFIPYFVTNRIQYIFFFLPSFWTGKAVNTRHPAYMLPSILMASAWICLLLRKFLKKIS